MIPAKTFKTEGRKKRSERSRKSTLNTIQVDEDSQDI